MSMFTVTDARTQFTLTDTATTKVKALIEAEDTPELALRVAVRPGGCSGFATRCSSTPRTPPTTSSRPRRRPGGHRPRVDRAPRRRVARLQGRPPGRRVHDQQPERAAHLRLRPVVHLSAALTRSDRSTAIVRVEVESRPTQSNLCCSCLRERLGISSVKDGVRRKVSAGVARCSSTASPRSAVSRRRCGRWPSR